MKREGIQEMNRERQMKRDGERDKDKGKEGERLRQIKKKESMKDAEKRERE